MALTDYKKTALGGIRAPARSKAAILGDVKKLQTSPDEAGLSRSQRDSAVEEITQDAANQGKEIAQDFAQQSLTGGYQGQAAEQARQQAKSTKEQAAAGRASVNQYSDKVARQFARETRARLEAQQERSRQNAKFWSQQGLKMAKAIPGLANSFKDMIKGFSK